MQKRNLFLLVLLVILFVINTVDSLFAAVADFNGYGDNTGTLYTPDEDLSGFKFLCSTGDGMGYQTNAGFDNSDCIYADYSGGSSSYLVLRRSNDSKFQISSIYLNDAIGFGSEDYDFIAYNNGTPATAVRVGTRTAGIKTINLTTADYVRIEAVGSPNDVAAFIDQITYTDVSSIVAPTAATDTASLINTTGAALNGTVDDGGAETTVTFEYGLTTSYGSVVTAEQSPISAGSGSGSVSAVITDLDPSVMYHFRVKAVNSEGTTYGSDLSFTTLPFANGDGTSGTPYQIATLSDLQILSENSNLWNKYYIQTANIDASATSTWNGGAGFTPIGNATINFTGNYDGDSFSISDLTIDRSTTDYIGLFGYVNSGSISNISLITVDIDGDENVGGLAGYLSGTTNIYSCAVTGSVSGNYRVGGVIGYDYMSGVGSIESSSFSGTLEARGSNSGIGGFIGEKSGNSIILKCSTEGTITAAGRNCGGFVGWIDEGEINQCFTTVNVTCNVLTDGRIGGFAGALAYYQNRAGEINNCYARGSVTVPNSTNTSSYGIGGFVGAYFDNSVNRVYNSYSTGLVTAPSASSYVGGFSGEDHGGGSPGSGNFWDEETTSNSWSGEDGNGETGETTANMKLQSTFAGAGWDFTDTWVIDGSKNDGYPCLQDNQPDAPLPVTLSSFTASFTGGSSTLNWTTQSESSNLGWNVYRSDTEEFAAGSVQNADLIEGAGTTTEPTDYIFSDPYPVSEGSDYWFWLESISFSGESEIFGPVLLEVPETEPGQNAPVVPETFGLYQNYPNPFNPTTEISFALEEAAKCELYIYDVKGRKVKTLFTGNIEANRVYSFIWNGVDMNGKAVSSGVYYYKIKAGKFSSTKKMILLK